MLEQALITSLKILFVYAAMRQGMILFPVRRVLDWMIDPLPPALHLWLRKPLYDCLFCMSSVWGMIFSWDGSLVEYVIMQNLWGYVQFLFIVAGINYIIQSFTQALDNGSYSE